MGLVEALALGVGGTIGGGIFVLIGAAAGIAGPGVLLSFSLAFAASLSIALPYAELSRRYPQAGGGYAFTRSVFGRGWGFFMGWGYWGAYVFISGYVSLGFGGYLHSLTGIPVALGATGLIALCVFLNLAGVRISGRTQAVVITLAIFALVTFSWIGLPHVNMENLSPFLPHGYQGVLAATLLCFLAFGGFDIIAAAGEEVRNPKRNLPLAMVLTLCTVLGIYLLVSYVAVGLVPWEQLSASKAPLSLAASTSIGPAFWPAFVAVAAILTTAATVNAVLVVTSRVMFAMARDGLMPSSLSLVSKANGIPWMAIICCGLLLAGISLAGSIALATAVGGFLYVVHFMFPLAASLKLRINESKQGGRKQQRFFRFSLTFVSVPIAVVFAGILILASGVTGILVGMSWLLVGATTFLLQRHEIGGRGQGRMGNQR